MGRPDIPLESMNDDWDPLDKAFWMRELRAECETLGLEWTDSQRAKRERQARWLAAYARTAGKTKANGAAQVTRVTSAQWTREDPIFGPLVPYAEQAYSDRLVGEMTRRGVEGISASIRDKRGDIIGEERKYSDTLLMHLTKGTDAQKRWVAKVDQTGVNEDRWRSVFNKIKDDPAMLAALDLIADATVGGAEG